MNSMKLQYLKNNTKIEEIADFSEEKNDYGRKLYLIDTCI